MEKDSSSTNYMIFLLSALVVGYFLLVTNPPPNLLRYDTDLHEATTYPLSASEIKNHAGSIVPFILMFVLISIISMFVVIQEVARTKKIRGAVRTSSLATISIIALATITYGYYGAGLFFVIVYSGFLGAAIGCILQMPYQRPRFLYSLNLFLFSAYFIIYFLVDYPYNQLWDWVAVFAILVSFVHTILFFRKYLWKTRRKK